MLTLKSPSIKFFIINFVYLMSDNPYILNFRHCEKFWIFWKIDALTLNVSLYREEFSSQLGITRGSVALDRVGPVLINP